MKNSDFVNTIIQAKKYKSYLEIGLARCKTFDAVECPVKIGVDPRVAERHNTHQQTSDVFFEKNSGSFDFIFIDGLHTCEQVSKDIHNALAILNSGGMIMVHDINPESEEMQVTPYAGQRSWNGDVWKAWVGLRSRSDIHQVGIDWGHGYGIITKGQQTPIQYHDLNYSMLEQNRKEMLNLITWTYFKRHYL